MALGSALGTCARWGIGLLQHAAAPGIPWGTLAVNVTGSFVIGLYAASVVPGGRFRVSEAQSLFVMAGLCGGFTTFSMFTAEVLSSLQRGQWWLAASLLVLSAGAWLAGAWAGYAAGHRLNPRGNDTEADDQAIE